MVASTSDAWMSRRTTGGARMSSQPPGSATRGSGSMPDGQPDRHREDRDPGDRHAGRRSRAAREGGDAHPEDHREHRQAERRQEGVGGDERDRKPRHGAGERPVHATAHVVTPGAPAAPAGVRPVVILFSARHGLPGSARRGAAAPAHRQR